MANEITPTNADAGGDLHPLFSRAARFIVKQSDPTLVQLSRELSVNTAAASVLIDQLAEHGIVMKSKRNNLAVAIDAEAVEAKLRELSSAPSSTSTDLTGPDDDESPAKAHAEATTWKDQTPTRRTLPLEQITVDQGIQCRVEFNPDRVAEYGEALKEGATFPPLVVFQDQDLVLLADGFHRHAAAASIGLLELEAEVYAGGRDQALLYAAGANASHGIRRTRADVRKAIRLLLRDPVWTRRSDRWIADMVNASKDTVGAIRDELVSSGEIRQCSTRTSRDGRKIRTPGQSKRRRNKKNKKNNKNSSKNSNETNSSTSSPAVNDDPREPTLDLPASALQWLTRLVESLTAAAQAEPTLEDTLSFEQARTLQETVKIAMSLLQTMQSELQAKASQVQKAA